jgi:SpoVK/Ycf46/Vps4 family AAA+-type ATPase
VSATPDSHALRKLLAETLSAAGDAGAACDEYGRLIDAGALAGDEWIAAGGAAASAGRADLLARCLDGARTSGVVDGVAALQDKADALAESRGAIRLVRSAQPDTQAELREETKLTFADVGGLAEIKKTIHRMIILPFQRPDLYAKYGKKAGGGVLMYGPPGVGKTLLARATAGECGLPFFAVRIEDILDPYFGVSERRLHDAFEQARARVPCVLFIDELDAIGFSRRKLQGSAGRPLVDQLLQELDGSGSDRRLLVLAATNAPWDVDDALKRPGRFDRLVFVPPPDAAARAAILDITLRDRPTRGINAEAFARRTPAFSGADLRALVDRALELVIDEALSTGREQPLVDAHLTQVLARMRPSTLEWLATARGYVEFANQQESYNDVAEYLKTSEAKHWKL